MSVKPLGDRVLVQPVEEQEVKEGRDHHSGHRQREASEGKVIALAPASADEDGKLIPFEVKKG